MKLRISTNKLTGVINKAVHPKIRIIESTSRKRRLHEEEEAAPEPKIEEKPFGGILTKEDADTFRQTPTEVDRARFERAKEKSMVVSLLFLHVNGRVLRIVSLLRGLRPRYHQALVPLPRRLSGSAQ
jgi:hypothetical protein